MATRNFVPRADGEGGIGTSAKQWAGGFFKKLAVVAITTAVTVLTPSADANNQQPATTSWVRTQFKSILEGVLSASGVKYNIAQNGYVCLGAFFGGLILQWGIISLNPVDDWIWTNVKFPVAFARACFSALCCDELTSDYTGNIEFASKNINTNSVNIFARSDRNGRKLRWLALGA